MGGSRLLDLSHIEAKTGRSNSIKLVVITIPSELMRIFDCSESLKSNKETLTTFYLKGVAFLNFLMSTKKQMVLKPLVLDL